MSSITVRKDLRGRFGPARDQGARPTCLAFATSDTHAATREPWSELCCEFLFYSAKQHDNTPPERAAKMGSVRHVLEKTGQPLEAFWPYLDKLPSDIMNWKPSGQPDQLFTSPSKHLGDSFQAAWDAVMGGSPVLIGMTTSRAFSRWDGDGVIDSAEPVEPKRRHAVIGVAVGERNGTNLLLIRNSWGKSWGHSGYAWLTERYATPRIKVVVILN
jgi:hypothetical protein